MYDLKFIKTLILLEMLAIYTAEYTNMLINNSKTKAFEDCKFNISRLQAAIKARKQSGIDAKITQPGSAVADIVHKQGIK